MRRSVAAILLILFSVLAAMDSTRLAADEPLARPRIVGHRGLLRHAPENTLAGFRACLELRIGFEVDVRRSADGQLVCVHDETLDRTTSGRGQVAERRLDALRKLDAGSWFDPAFRGEQIPTLGEVFQALGRIYHDVPVPWQFGIPIGNRVFRAVAPTFPDVFVAVDLKAADIEADAVRLAVEHRVLDRVLFIGTAISMPEVRQRLRLADAKSHVAALANQPAELDAALADQHADWVYVRYVPQPAEVARVHRAGKHLILVGPTVAGEERENWRKAASAGVDAILTDFPLHLRQAQRE